MWNPSAAIGADATFGSVVTAGGRNTTEYCPLVDPVVVVDNNR